MPLAQQVILFVIDGLRPDALQQASTPQIDQLVAQGAYTWRAQTVTPSISLPCHTSLFFAVPPARHGVVSNVWTRPQPPVPSLIEMMSSSYLLAVSKTDRAIGLVVEALRTSGRLAETVCLVLADHGGQDFDHDAGLAEDLTIPWIISGPGIRRSHQITSAVNIIDTAPTIAYFLGLPTPAEWSGRVVTEVLAV